MLPINHADFTINTLTVFSYTILHNLKHIKQTTFNHLISTQQISREF